MMEEGMMLVMMVVMCKYKFVISVVQIGQIVLYKYRFFLRVIMLLVSANSVILLFMFYFRLY